MTYDEVAKLIKKNNGVTVDFGASDCELVPSQARVDETEKVLQVKLPPSFLWFLKNYGGGTVFGDDIYSISKVYSERDMFDVASRTISDRKDGFINDDEIAICNTDFGEQFVMDTSKRTNDGEYPIIRKMGEVRTQIADSFVDFLGQYISEKVN